MTRKDTIMIAVLVNAALLIGLFVTSIKRDDLATGKQIAEVKQIELAATQPKQEIKTAQGDEIDQVLKEFSQKANQKVEVPKKEEKAPPQKIDFAKELEAITKKSTPAQSRAIATTSTPRSTSEVKVQKGDVLSKIANRHNTTVDAIVQLNNLKTTVLQIGQTLKIPSSDTKKVASTGGSEFYIVKAGDNPWSIAVKNHLKLEELLKLNDLNEQKARRLKPGDKLRIK